MKDSEIQEFIYNRLINIYGENPNIDYMKRLKESIENTKRQEKTNEEIAFEVFKATNP